MFIYFLIITIILLFIWRAVCIVFSSHKYRFNKESFGLNNNNDDDEDDGKTTGAAEQLLQKVESDEDQKLPEKCIKTLIVLGSGGHTTEMINILKVLNKRKYRPRIYFLADNDKNSEMRISELEKNWSIATSSDFKLVRIFRSRKVGQSYFTSIWSTIYSILYCIPLVYTVQPQLVLANGPGTCVPICFIAFLYKFFYINPKCFIVFIESYCRVKTLSLTGKILLWFTDLFIVQWPYLMNYSKKAQYFGRLS